jgi:hypothetical protein
MNKLLIIPIFVILLIALYLIGTANYLILVSGITTPSDYMIVGLTLLFTATTFNAIKNNK